MFVCLCKSITDRQIHQAIDAGVSSFESMQEELDVSTACGSCSCEVKKIIMEKFKANLSANQALGNLNRGTVQQNV